MKYLLTSITTILLLTACVKDRIITTPTVNNGTRTIMHYWNFNGSSTTVPAFTVGGGLLSFDFLTVPDSSSTITGYADLLSPVTPTTNINAQNGDSAGNALRVRNPCSDFIIAAPTTGYKDIILSYSVAKTTKGASTDSVYYTIDGINYTNAGLSTLTYSPGIDPAYTLESFDLTSIAAVNNNPNFKFKITFSSGNLGTSGNDRFDNITVFGNSTGSNLNNGTPVISSAATATGMVNSVFPGYTITASNAPTSFAITNLPAGLVFNSTTGAISGTPIASGVFIDTIKAINTKGTGVQVLTITISPAASITLLHYWNFNDTTTTTTLITPTSTIGGGSLAFDFSGSPIGYYDFVSPSLDTAAGNNARNGDPAGTLLRVRNPSVDFIITAPTTNYKNIVLKFDVARTSKGAQTDSVYYSTDGVNYINTGLTPSFAPLVDPIYSTMTFDFTAVPAVNNNPNFKFKIVFSNGNTNTSGNDRFDNLTVEGYHQ